MDKESTPDPEIATLVASLIRHLLTVGATLGVVHGVYSDSVLTIAAGALVGIGTTGWALYQKFAAAKDKHSAAVASAQAGMAIK